MEVSVIIPAYGHPSYLLNSINSVINQTYADWELIVVDDNNPSSKERCDTVEIMKKVTSSDERIKYVQHERNMNGSVARNTGLSIAKGKFVAFLDSDDEYMPDRLECCLDAILRESEKIAGVYTGCEFRRSGKTYYKSVDVSTGNHLVATLACTFGFYTGSNIFIRKSVIDELNGFDPGFVRHQDYEFLVRLFLKYDLKAIPKILVIKNNEGFNVPSLQNIIKTKRMYLNKYNSIINTLSPEDQRMIYQRHCVAIAEAAIRQRLFSEAKKYYMISKKYAPLSYEDWKRRLFLSVYYFFK